MKTLSLFCIVLSLIVLASCGDDDPAPQPTVATITVTVQDSGSSQTVSGANVILYNSSTGDAVKQALTGSNGQCSFSIELGGAGFGTFSLRVSAQGVQPFAIGHRHTGSLPGQCRPDCPAQYRPDGRHPDGYRIDQRQGRTGGGQHAGRGHPDQ
ncbi:MAG TPA: hypothetical protein PK297_10085 [Spirochaetota bacterium]|nr:hypothetical protein [Spirochaetota bacterium]